MKPQNTTLNEKNKLQFCMIAFMQISRRGKLQRQENRPGVVQNWQWEKRSAAKKHKGIFGSDRNILKLDYGDGCSTYKFIKTKN